MAKKCIICNGEAKYKIKDSTEYYCLDCAQDSFADLSVLQKVEEAAKILKQLVVNKIDGNLQNNSDRKT